MAVQAPAGRSPTRLGGGVAALRPVAWEPAGDLELPAWIEAGRFLGSLGRSSQWGLGDWIRYGNTRFGERYTRAVKITGYDRQTLMNMAYVASRFDISRRRETLTWSHHEAIAALDADEQDAWLDRIEAERWTIADLRQALRESRGRRGEPAEEDHVLEVPGSVRCPNCGTEVPLAGGERQAATSAASSRGPSRAARGACAPARP